MHPPVINLAPSPMAGLFARPGRPESRVEERRAAKLELLDALLRLGLALALGAAIGIERQWH